MIHLQRKQSPVILFLPHDALQSTVMQWYVICPPVRPSVTFVYHGHIVLTFLKITTKISLWSLLPVANKHWSASWGPEIPGGLERRETVFRRKKIGDKCLKRITTKTLLLQSAYLKLHKGFHLVLRFMTLNDLE